MTDTMTKKRRRWPWVVLGLVVLSVTAVMLSVDAIAAWRMRQVFATFEGYDFTFARVHVSLLKGGVVIHDLKMMKQSAGGSDQPYFFCKKLQFSVYGSRIKEKHAVMRVEADEAQVNLIVAKTKEATQVEPETPDMMAKVKAALPLDVDRIEVKRSQFVVVDKTEPTQPKFWLHDFDAVIENMAPRAARDAGEPTTASLSGTVQKSGELSVFVTLDPADKGLTFAGKAAIKHVNLEEFYSLMSTKTGMHISKGRLDVSAEFVSKDGVISGTVKPVILDPVVSAGKPGADNYLRAAFADGIVNLVTRQTDDGHRTLATTVPIAGKVTNPRADLYPVILGVLRNAFVIGIQQGAESAVPGAPKEKS